MAPKAEKKPAKKVAKKVAGGKGKKGKSKVESFKIYIYKVLKQVSILAYLLLSVVVRVNVAHLGQRWQRFLMLSSVVFGTSSAMLPGMGYVNTVLISGVQCCRCTLTLESPAVPSPS